MSGPDPAQARPVLVIEHEDSCPPAFVAEWLVAEGVDLDVRRPYRGDELPFALSSYAGLVVLGGAMGAYDDQEHAWLPDTKRLIAGAVADRTPVWGICLGHQLMTVALGGEVQANPAGRASGLTPVGWANEAHHDLLCTGVRRDAVAVQWNDDIASRLPAGAAVLATSPDGAPQVVRYGPRAWGVQFHPEVGGDIFALWATSARQRDPHDAGADVALAQIREHEAALRQAWQPMAKAFAALLGSHPSD